MGNMKKPREVFWLTAPAEVPADRQLGYTAGCVSKEPEDDSGPQLSSQPQSPSLPNWGLSHRLPEASCSCHALARFLAHGVHEHEKVGLYH